MAVKGREGKSRREWREEKQGWECEVKAEGQRRGK